MSRNVIIIGSGPAGMMAAITAAAGGHRVTVLEKNDRPCRKIYATGNGRCNFTNTFWNDKVIRSESPDQVHRIIDQFDHRALTDFFAGLGVPARDINGYLYPHSEQASSVAEALFAESRKQGVELVLNAKVNDIKRNRNAFDIFTDVNHFYADDLVIACGGKASPAHGSDGNLNKVIRKLGHHFVKQIPALVPLKFSDLSLMALAGVRVRCRAELLIDDIPFDSETGEIIFNKNNISGIPVMQLSRHAIRALEEKKKVALYLDFFPETGETPLTEMLQRLFFHADNRKKTAKEVCIGFLNLKLLERCFLLSGIKADKEAYSAKQKSIFSLIEQFKSFKVDICGCEGFDKAQVTAGGVSLSEVDENLMSKETDGLYFAGEILDADGTCGGYNLQWAFSSGFVAGKSI